MHDEPFFSKFACPLLLTTVYCGATTAVKRKKKPDFDHVDEVADLFSGVANLDIRADTPVDKVNGFEAHEIARWVGQLNFEEEPIVKACLSFWYLIGSKNELPLIVEFSFDYDLPEEQEDPAGLEQYPIPVAAGAFRFFMTLQRQLDWVNLNATTKTAYAYEAL